MDETKEIRLTLENEPTEKLLNQIAAHVIYTELLSIALDVGIDEARLTHIQADFPGQAKNQIFRVQYLFIFLTPASPIIWVS